MWTVAVLLAIIAALLLRLPNGSAVGEYISFSASIASLVLAVVAIGQALVANQGFSETVGTLRSSSDELRSAATNIAETSATLNQRCEDIIGQVAKVPAAVEALGAKLDEQVASAVKPEVPVRGLGDDVTYDIINNMPMGGQLSLYVLAKSFVSGKAFDTSDVFSKDTHYLWTGVLLGFIFSVMGMNRFNIKVDTIHRGMDTFYKVSSLGDVNAKTCIETLESEQNQTRDDELYKGVRAFFDN